MGDFNVNEWEEMCKKYERNKDGLNFSAECRITEGKISIKVTNVDTKYKPIIEKLMLKNARGAMIVMCNTVKASYVTNDKDLQVEQKKCEAIISKNMEPWFNALFSKGLAYFLELLTAQYMILKTSYMLSDLKLVNGAWSLSDGSYWNGMSWVTKDGKEYYEPYEIWSSILGNIKDPNLIETNPNLQIA